MDWLSVGGIHKNRGQDQPNPSCMDSGICDDVSGGTAYLGAASGIAKDAVHSNHNMEYHNAAFGSCSLCGLVTQYGYGQSSCQGKG